ncbi:CLUMA_CG018637, isoform A [Clunio marinus]|uniref:CLUMA_CG018637, isoform A n=1 Tax=Clunio marinus TaxID=568069 RepID=A0A1J1IZI4_9DIPT|nr:CLUMA_CG018637, isoform A [Clunio marinus]
MFLPADSLARKNISSPSHTPHTLYEFETNFHHPTMVVFNEISASVKVKAIKEIRWQLVYASYEQK